MLVFWIVNFLLYYVKCWAILTRACVRVDCAE